MSRLSGLFSSLWSLRASQEQIPEGNCAAVHITDSHMLTDVNSLLPNDTLNLSNSEFYREGHYGAHYWCKGVRKD